MWKLFKKLWKVISSRYFLCSILIIIELVMLFLIEKYLIEWSIVFRIFSYLVSLVTFIYLINMDMSVEGKLPWIVIILLIQPFGALLFLMFGIRLITKREKKFFKNLISSYSELLCVEESTLNKLKEEDYLAYQKAFSLSHDTSSSLYQNTTCEYFSTGEAFYQNLLASLKEANNYIFMEYFIIAEGKMWDSILDILLEKVKSGVEVRFMYDDIGSLFNVHGDYFKKLEKLGIKSQCFAKYTGKANSSHNNRNHRKITVIDGKVAFTGGINLADEYINEIKRFGYWKDSAIKLKGEAVKEMVKIFLYDWDLNKGEITSWINYLKLDEKEKTDGYFLPFGTGPKPLYSANIAKNMYLNLINQASKYIYITTPYLIIDKELTQSLINASKRKVDVKIILPHVPDKKIVYAMTKSSYLTLIKAGVKIYEYEVGFIHAKNFICDDCYAVCGTINFDYRSLLHHYENAVWIYKSSVIINMKDDFRRTINSSIIQTESLAKQNIMVKLFVRFINIFAPFF